MFGKRNEEVAERLGLVLKLKRLWQEKFPDRKIVASASIGRSYGIEQILDGILYHYELQS